MSTNLDSLFNAPAQVRLESPVVKYDYAKKESLRFRLGGELGSFKLIIRHWVESVGYVACNQKPYKRQDGTFGIWGDCHFCAEKKALKEKLMEVARAENRELTKPEADRVQNTFKRQIMFAAPVEVEVRCGGKVVKELENKAILFRASDMFFSHLNQHYKVLAQVSETKGTLTKNWFTMASNGSIMMDDPLTKEEQKKEIVVDMTYFEASIKPYEVGEAVIKGKLSAVELAQKLPNVEVDLSSELDDVF